MEKHLVDGALLHAQMMDSTPFVTKSMTSKGFRLRNTAFFNNPKWREHLVPGDLFDALDKRGELVYGNSET